MKILATFLTGLLAFAAFAQDLTKPIAYTTPAKPLRLVLADLSKQTGLKLQTTADMEEEPLILRLQAVPLKEVMDRMADVFAADWVDHHGYLQLERSDDKIAAIRAALLAKRTEGITASIDALIKLEQDNPPLNADNAKKMISEFQRLSQLEKNGDSSDTRKMRFALESQLPGMRFALKVLAKMNPAELASMADNTRIVFSTSPNAAQRQLPDWDPDDFQALVDGRATMATALKAFPGFGGDTDGFNQNYTVIDDSLPITAKPARMIAAVWRAFGTEQVDFTLFDDKGNQIVQDSESIGVKWDELLASRGKTAVLQQEARKDGYELGPIAQEMASRIGHSSAELRALPQQVSQVLLSPTTTEPLSLATSDTLLIGAQQAGLNVIALPADSNEELALVAARQGKTSLAEFQNMIRRSGVSMTMDDGWIVLKPDDPEEISRYRIPRPALEEFVSQIVKDGYVSIESAANLRAQCDRDSGAELAQDAASLLLPNSNDSSALWSQSVDTMRLYGSLTSDQKEAARHGGITLSLNSLSPEQLQMAQSLVFDNFTQLTYHGKQDSRQVGADPSMQEKTDILPNGLPAATVIKVDDKVSDAAYTTMTSSMGSSYTYPQSLDDIAYSLVQQEHPELYPEMNQQRVSGWKLGKQRTVNVQVEFGDYGVEDQISENHEPAGPSLSAQAFLATLPDPVRKQIQKQMQDAFDSMTRYRQQAGNKTTPATTGGTAPPAKS